MKKMLIALVLGVFSIAGNAALIDRGGGFIYDDVLNITWTQSTHILGADIWDNQVAKAAELSLFDSVRNVTWSDWRLASMDVNGDGIIMACSGGTTELECRDNEYGYLNRQYGVSETNPGFFMFEGVQSDLHWSGTTSSTNPTKAWWYFFDLGGRQNANGKDGSKNAWTVRDGDVAAVPAPAAVWLFGSALGLLGWMKRKTM